MFNTKHNHVLITILYFQCPIHFGVQTFVSAQIQNEIGACTGMHTLCMAVTTVFNNVL